MFGGDDINLGFPISMLNIGLPYDSNVGQQLQLDVNQLVKTSMEGPILRHQKDPISLSILKQDPISTGLGLSYGEGEQNSSITSEIVRQNDELDRYIKLQEENFRKAVIELGRRQTLSLLTTANKVVSRKLNEKDTEIEIINLKNNELTEKIKQISVQAQSWRYKAQQNEFLVNHLRNNINQIILQSSTPDLKEGSGETLDEDIASSRKTDPKNLNPFESFGDPLPSIEDLMNCKACKIKEVTILLLPCRHLCLCVDCSLFIDVCPVCRVKRIGTFQVNLS